MQYIWYRASSLRYYGVWHTQLGCDEILCFNVETGMVETIRFLRMNKIHKCADSMGGADLADWLRGTWCIHKEARNRKWLWSILFWVIGIIIINAYVIYLHVNIENRIKKDLLSHNNFSKSVALTWINPRGQDTESFDPVSTRKKKILLVSSVPLLSGGSIT